MSTAKLQSGFSRLLTIVKYYDLKEFLNNIGKMYDF